MRGRVVLLLVALLLLAAPTGSRAAGEEEPLTLLDKPVQTGQPGHPGQPATPGLRTEELHDIYGPVTTAEPSAYLWPAGLTVLLAVAFFLFYRWWRKRPKPGPPQLPPWERALNDLAEARSLLRPEHGLLYMDRASTILRNYIERRFAIQSTRQTTREFLTGLQSVTPESPLNRYRGELQDCLEQADLAKFAQYRPQQQHLESMEEAVTSFVHKSRPTTAAEEDNS